MRRFLPPLLSLAAITSLPAANLALSGTATQSSTRGGVPSTASGGNEARFAIDRNRNGNFGGGSVTHTNGGATTNQWWQVDLGSNKNIDSLALWNRTGCCQNRLDNFMLSVINAAGNTTFTTTVAAGSSGLFNPVESFAMPLGGVIGQTVRIDQLGPNSNGNQVLSLAEVEVFGSEFSHNIARFGTATQSTTRGGVPSGASGGNEAFVAIDGITNGFFTDQDSVTHTGTPGVGQWWEVALPSATGIREITAVNRADCCTGRLADIQYDVYRNGSVVWSSTESIGGDIYHDVLPPVGVIGDTIRLTQLSGQHLSLAEVLVFVPEPSRAMLLMLGLLPIALRRSRA